MAKRKTMETQGYCAVSWECPDCGLYQFTEGQSTQFCECDQCDRKVLVLQPKPMAAAGRLLQKVAHGCTDAWCSECDG